MCNIASGAKNIEDTEMNENVKGNLELIIIGGGPAGMSAALVAGRSRLNTVVINAESPRNKVTTASHGFLTRDGVHPLELLRIAKQQLEKYETITYTKGFVTDVSKSEHGFRIMINDEEAYETEAIIFATGYKENVKKSNLRGIERVYGKSVYPCPFCDGWEHRDQKLALFDETEFSVEFAKLIANWSSDVILFTNGKQVVSEHSKQFLKLGGVAVVEGVIAELISDQDGNLQSVLLEDGKHIEREAGFLFNTYEEPATSLPEKLGVGKKLSEWGSTVLDVDESGQTNVKGVYIIGDAMSGFGGIVAAANDGAKCVEMIVHNRVQTHWASLEKA